MFYYNLKIQFNYLRVVTQILQGPRTFCLGGAYLSVMLRAIWNLQNTTFGRMRDNIGYNPWEGRTIKGWPTQVILHEIIWPTPLIE